MRPTPFLGVRHHLGPELGPPIEFAYVTGWRIPSEVLPLGWRNVDMNASEVRLDPGTTKNREGRVFPMTDDLRALLEERRRLTKTLERKLGRIIPWVFFRVVKDRDGREDVKPIRRLDRPWKAACKAAGCPGRIPHDLRRTAIRNMVRRGITESVAMKLAGHKTRSVFQRYNVTTPGDLRAAAEQLSGLTGTKKGQSGISEASAGNPGSRK